MTILRRWLGILVLSTAIDLGVRFMGSFSFQRVLWTEAALFLLTAFALVALRRNQPRLARGKERLQILLIAAFFLAGLRSGLWAFGIPVGTVNVMVLLAAVVIWVGFRMRPSR